MNQKIVKIKLRKLISDKLITRKAVQLIEAKISQLSKSQRSSDLTVELDFINIKFISRSFTDEIYNLERTLLKSKAKLAFINMDKEIKNMFKIVSRHRSEPEVKRPKLKIKVKNLKSLVYQF